LANKYLANNREGKSENQPPSDISDKSKAKRHVEFESECSIIGDKQPSSRSGWRTIGMVAAAAGLATAALHLIGSMNNGSESSDLE